MVLAMLWDYVYEINGRHSIERPGSLGKHFDLQLLLKLVEIIWS